MVAQPSQVGFPPSEAVYQNIQGPVPWLRTPGNPMLPHTQGPKFQKAKILASIHATAAKYHKSHRDLGTNFRPKKIPVPRSMLQNCCCLRYLLPSDRSPATAEFNVSQHKHCGSFMQIYMVRFYLRQFKNGGVFSHCGNTGPASFEKKCSGSRLTENGSNLCQQRKLWGIRSTRSKSL